MGEDLAMLVSLSLLGAAMIYGVSATGNCPHRSDHSEDYCQQHTTLSLFYSKIKFIFLLSAVGVSEKEKKKKVI